MRVVVDAMGGDNAPASTVRGAIMASAKWQIPVTLVGREKEISELLKAEKEASCNIEVKHAPGVFTMDDDGASLLREHKDSSMALALSLAAQDGYSAFVSAGSTGGILTGATLLLKRIRGVRRAALAPFVPTAKGSALLIDCGANVECTAEYLLQFAVMGSAFSKRVKNIASPKIGLLNNGSEAGKGTPMHREAYEMLTAAKDTLSLNFVGNIEGRDVPEGVVDVIVCDGFTGNIMLKTIEGVGLFFMGTMKDIFHKSTKNKLAGALIKPDLRALKSMMDYKETGGAPLLGIRKPVIKAHGSSDAYAFMNAIKLAHSFAAAGVIEEIEKSVG